MSKAVGNVQVRIIHQNICHINTLVHICQENIALEITAIITIVNYSETKLHPILKVAPIFYAEISTHILRYFYLIQTIMVLKTSSP